MNLDQFLQKIPLFSGVSPEVVSRFKASLAGPQKIPPSSILATRGALVEHLFFIATGSLSVTITRYKRGLESSSDDRHSSRTLMLEAFYPGELVGDLELTSELPRWNADVVVLEEAVIYCIRKEALAMILASSPQLIFNLYRADLVRIRQSEQALVDTAFYLVEKRLFERLVFLLLQQGEVPVELDSLVGVVLEDTPTHT
jgi:CRP-like cAMP-binding protein